MKNIDFKKIIEFILVAIIPIITLGFGIFTDTGLLNKVFGLNSAENAVVRSLSSEGQTELQKFITRDQKDYKDTWEIIKENTSAELPDSDPHYISRLGVQNYPYVTVNGNKKIIVPGETPIVVGFCEREGMKFGECEMLIVGSINDLDRWIQEKEDFYRNAFDVLFALISISLGIYLYRIRPQE